MWKSRDGYCLQFYDIWLRRTRQTVCNCPKDALSLGSKRNGTKLESCVATLNLAKCRQFKSEGFKHIQTVLRTITYYPTLCIEDKFSISILVQTDPIPSAEGSEYLKEALKKRQRLTRS